MKRGFTLTELLVAIIISSIILLAVVSMFITSNRALRSGRDVSEMSEDVRNAITTLEYIFSRWGSGVPCANNQCSIGPTIPDCPNTNLQPPPNDPMCMTISGQEVRFFANLYGTGFVVSVSGNQANIISCRLNTGNNQNCYYIWNGGRLKTGFGTRGRPVPVQLASFSGQPDCIGSNAPNLTISTTVNRWLNEGNGTILEPGDYITRAPHYIRLYVKDDGWLMMDRTDMGVGCQDNAVGENAVRIGRVQSFSAQKVGRSVRIDVVFVGSDDRTYRIVRVYGR